MTVELRAEKTEGGSLGYRYRGSREQVAGAVLALVLEGIAAGTWRRLKVCPDCQTVFYDRTKPQNRVWCGMFAHGPAVEPAAASRRFAAGANARRSLITPASERSTRERRTRGGES